MRYIYYIFFILSLSLHNNSSASDLVNYLESAYKNNPLLNAERKNLKKTQENINIARSKFLPSVSISGTQNSKQTTGRTNQAGGKLSDTNNNTTTETISVEQKIFQGFDGYNNFKKSKLEVDRAKFKLRNTEQEILLKSATAYYDLIYKTKSEKINKDNVNLFERQVESDSARLQRGEITLVDLAQSESSLAGANAKLISAETELATINRNFERIVGASAPKQFQNIFQLNINLPNGIDTAITLSSKNNLKLVLAKLEYEIASKEVIIEKSKFSPSALLNYSQSKNKDYSSAVDNVDQEDIKATVTWPLFKGGENYSSFKKAKFKKEQYNLIFLDTTNEVKTDTYNAWSIYKSSAGILTSTQAAVKAAEIANEGITLEYDSGSKRTTLEVIQSRSLLLDSRISKAKAERNFAISKFQLLFVLGELTLENIKKS